MTDYRCLLLIVIWGWNQDFSDSCEILIGRLNFFFLFPGRYFWIWPACFRAAKYFLMPNSESSQFLPGPACIVSSVGFLRVKLEFYISRRLFAIWLDGLFRARFFFVRPDCFEPGQTYPRQARENERISPSRAVPVLTMASPDLTIIVSWTVVTIAQSLFVRIGTEIFY